MTQAMESFEARWLETQEKDIHAFNLREQSKECQFPPRNHAYG